MTRTSAAVLVFASICAFAQTQDVSPRNVYGGSTLPPTCNVRDSFQLTSASSSAQWYLCTAPNTWTAQGGSGGTGTPQGSTNDIQSNAGGGNFQGTGGKFQWNPTQTGITLNVTNPNAANNTGDASAFNSTCNYTLDSITTPNFSDMNCWQMFFNPSMGQGNYGPNPNYEAKKTFVGFLMQNSYAGSGQKFGTSEQITCLSMSDCGADQKTITYAGGPIVGDENQGYTTQSYLTQPGNLTTTSVTSSSPTRTPCNTYITQAIVRSNTAQAFTVNSTTGCSVNDWVVLAQEPPTRGQSEQAMQITAVGTGTISGIVKNSYQVPSDTNVSTAASNTTITLSTSNSNILPGNLAIGGSIPAGTYVSSINGTSVTLTQAPTSTATGVTVNFYVTVTPATVITVNSTGGFGQDRFLVDTSTTQTGNVATVSGGGFTSAATDFSYGMVGGSFPLAGCINLSADTYSGGYSGPGGGGFSGTPLNSWYAINSVTSTSQLGILTSSVAGDSSYHGNGSISTQGTTNGTTTVNLTGGLWWQTFNGEYVTGSDIPAGTTIVSGGGTQTLVLSNAATSSTTNENLTIQGGPYTVSPCARVLYWTGSTVVLETNSFAWTLGHSLELAIVSYPDSEGFQYSMAQYTTGGADHDYTGSSGRAFIHLMNRGAREIPNGIMLHNLMQTGSNADKVAFGTGIAMPQVYYGMTIGEAQSGQAISTTATNTTLGSKHPCYSISGGAMGTNTFGGICGDITTGRVTLETGRGQVGNNTATPSVTTIPPISGTAAEFVYNADFPGSTTGISGTIARPSTAQDFQVCYFLHPTTTGTAGTATASFTWQDSAGNTMTKSGSSVSLSSATAVDSACFPIIDGVNGYIQYSVSVSGATGSPAYDFRYYFMRMML